MEGVLPSHFLDMEAHCNIDRTQGPGGGGGEEEGKEIPDRVVE